MTLIECIVNENIFIDFEKEIIYGSDQQYVSYPSRFASVSFSLIDTKLLNRLADRIRIRSGFKPLVPAEENATEENHLEKNPDEMTFPYAWYEFFIGLNDFTESKVDSCICFTVQDVDSPDDGESYTIDLGEDEQKFIYKRLDEQCREHLGKSCEELLAEARRRMEEDN